VVYRSGAKAGDLIYVSGDLGAAYLGLQLLEREKQVFLADPNMRPQLEEHAYLVGRQLKPEARVDIIEKLKLLNIQPTSMMDISDGLSSELLHICTASKVGCVIDEDQLPIAAQAYEQAVAFQIDPITCALNGGEDYELVMTVPAQYQQAIQDIDALTLVGKILDEGEGYWLRTKNQQKVELKAQGWNPLLQARKRLG
jgi:thiamine-monophosphate kinase